MMWVPAALVFIIALAGSNAASKNDYRDDIAKYIYGDNNRHLIKNFDILTLGRGYGISKRLTSPSNYETGSQKERRGPMNGLIPGGAFGRSVRNIRYAGEPLESFIRRMQLSEAVEEDSPQHKSPPVMTGMLDIQNFGERYDGELLKALLDKSSDENMSSVYNLPNIYKTSSNQYKPTSIENE